MKQSPNPKAKVEGDQGNDGNGKRKASKFTKERYPPNKIPDLGGKYCDGVPRHNVDSLLHDANSVGSQVRK